MEETVPPEIFGPAVSAEEWRQIPSEIGTKILAFVEEKVEQLCTAHALAETARFNAIEELQNVKNDAESNRNANKQLDLQLQSAQNTISELELQVSICTADMNKLQEHSSELEVRAADCRRKREIAEDEKNDYLRMLERRNAELDRMKSEMTLMTTQLQAAITAKCDALANSEEVASMKLNLEYRERQLEQTTALLNNQVKLLTEDLNKRTEDLMNVRRDNTNRIILLETKLTNKTEELQIANDKINGVTKINQDLSAKIEELTEDLLKQKDTMTKTHESYQLEVEAQSKEAQLYKEMFNDNKAHTEKLTKGIHELQDLLGKTTEEYAELEQKYKELEVTHDEILAKKNECIEMLKKELDIANEFLKNAKEDNLQREVEEISPAAATASRLIRSDMSLTQIYTQYTQVVEKLQAEEDKNRSLNNYINKILEEIQEKAPYLRKQREEYDQAMDMIAELTKQVDNLTQENNRLREENSDVKRSEGIASRENARLKKEIADLGRQVCHLLREVEQSRSGSLGTSVDQDLSDSASSADVISKKLVTFSDILELQAKNQQLLALVRELSSKHEEAEGMDVASIAHLKRKLDQMREAHAETLERQMNQDKMLSSIISQRDMYKNLYQQVMKSAANDDVPLQLDRSYAAVETSGSSHSPKPSEDSLSGDNKATQDLENKLNEANKEIAKLKEEYETYRKERNDNEKILLEQLEGMRTEIKELTVGNCKLTSANEYKDERYKTIKSNIEMYKKQISALEEKNKTYSKTIVKHEQALMHMRDELLNSNSRASKSEVMLANLKQENQLLKDSENRLQKERESVCRASQAQSILLNNVELIKATLERNEAESKIRLEARLDDATRECSALRRRLQEEQDRFREITEHLESQTKLAQDRVEEERAEANRLREELLSEKEEVIKRANQIDELSKKLKNNLISPLGFKTGSTDEQVKELKHLLEESEGNISSLNTQLASAKEQLKQYCSIAEGAEKEVKNINEHWQQFRELTDVKMKENEETIIQLQEKCNELNAELHLQNDGQRETNYDLKTRLSQLEHELQATTEELEKTKSELETAQEDIRQLSESLKMTDEKYTNEVVLHSNDLQALTALKTEFTNLSSEINQLKHAKQEAVDALETSKESWDIQQQLFNKEKVEIENRLQDLDSQNQCLLDQIQNFNAQLAVIHAQATGDISMNQSSSGDGVMNRSFAEDEAKSTDQFLKIIKYLRKEKDISVSKCDILEAENTRLKTQYELTTKQLEEAKAALSSERQQSEVDVITTAKHSEVLRKVETLNAITDSNRILRQERDTLSNQVKELTERTNCLEQQLAPMQEMNRELSQKAESAQTENLSLRAEATRWRQRANILIEKSNRTSPEDWKKLNNEKDQLAKQLATEKETHRKLNEELLYARQHKERLEDQVTHLQGRCTAQVDELRKLNEEMHGLKQNVQRLSAELEEARSNLNKLTSDNTKITEELGEKDSALAESTRQFISMKKIAKKFKGQYEELHKVVEEENQKKREREESGIDEQVPPEKQEQYREEGRKELQERIAQLERNLEERNEELHSQITNYIEENDNLKKEIEELKKTTNDKDERAKMLLKTAKGRIMDLTEAVKTKNTEIDEMKNRITLIEQGEESSATPADIARLEREKNEILEEKQQERERLQREIETLNQRVNALQRQLGAQQGSKPSTSSSSSDKPTSEPPTANIKPMSGGHPTTQTQSVTVTPWRSSGSGETPLASIRPMTMSQNLRTAAVLPSQVGQQPCMVPPQQQVVHTTGNSSIEIMSSSPTSSHTDYMPATSSASPALMTPRQVAVPPTQSNQDSGEEQQTAPQQQAVAMVLPRIEIPSGGSQEQGTSSSSSNTVTTTQAGLKRPREADTDSSQSDEPSKVQQQTKRTRMQTGTAEPFQGVSESGIEVEYQVPTSSQRDQEEDVIVLSEDEGPDEGEGGDDVEPDDANGEGYDMEALAYEREQELNYEEDNDCQEMDEQDNIAEDNNEVEVNEDSSEVPNQSSSSQFLPGTMSEINSQESGHHHQAHPEATSSGSDGNSGITMSQAGSTFGTRTRPVAPLSRQQQQGHLVLGHHGHGLEEGGDDSIVPSTPTLYVPRRTDGFGEAVSSPHVPSSGRFTFSESVPNIPTGSERIVEDNNLDLSQLDDSHSSTGRSVPSTPQQTSPQESGPGGEEQSSHQSVQDNALINLEEADPEQESIDSPMGPPLNQTMSSSTSAPGDNVQQPEEEMLEGDDGVSSEGEKAPSGSGEEEGREAEATETPSSNTRSRGTPSRGVNVARRTPRQGFRTSASGVGGRGTINRPTPIVWGEQQQQQSPRQEGLGRGRGSQESPRGGYSRSQRSRRSSRPHRQPFARY